MAVNFTELLENAELTEDVKSEEELLIVKFPSFPEA